MESRVSVYEWVLLTLVLVVLAWSGIGPHDRFTWFLEVAPVLIGVPIFFVMPPVPPHPAALTLLLAIHAVILMVGGNYTYAEVPPASGCRTRWVRAEPLRPARSLRAGFRAGDPGTRDPLRTLAAPGQPVAAASWSSALPRVQRVLRADRVWTARASGEAATDFLGTQGDCGTRSGTCRSRSSGRSLALVLLSGAHDRQLRGVESGGRGNGPGLAG